MSSSVGMWGTTLDHQHHQCLKTSPNPVPRKTTLPNPATDDTFGRQCMSLLPREAADSESLRMAFNIAKKEHGTTSTSSSTLEWERELRLATGYHQVLRTQCFPSRLNIPDRDRCGPFSIPTISVLYTNRASPEAKYANAIIHPRLPYAARDSHSFQLGDISTYSVLNPMVRYRSITAHPFGILIPGIAYCGQSHAPEPLSTSFLVFTVAYIAVDHSHIYREKKLGKTWQLAEPADTAPCTLYGIECDG